MKKEWLFWILTAALALAMGFVPELGSGLFAVLALPFVALGRMLRWLSLTGAVGNGLALVGYAAACASPVLLWLRPLKRKQNRKILEIPMRMTGLPCRETRTHLLWRKKFRHPDPAKHLLVSGRNCAERSGKN